MFDHIIVISIEFWAEWAPFWPMMMDFEKFDFVMKSTLRFLELFRGIFDSTYHTYSESPWNFLQNGRMDFWYLLSKPSYDHSNITHRWTLGVRWCRLARIRSLRSNLTSDLDSTHMNYCFKLFTELQKDWWLGRYGAL